MENNNKTNSINTTLPYRISMIRYDNNLNYQEFGAKLKVSGQIVKYWEDGVRNPTDKNLANISNTFNVDYIWLKFGTGKMKNSLDGQFLIVKKSKLNELLTLFNQYTNNTFLLDKKVNKLISDILSISDVMNSFTDEWFWCTAY